MANKDFTYDELHSTKTYRAHLRCELCHDEWEEDMTAGESPQFQVICYGCRSYTQEQIRLGFIVTGTWLCKPKNW